MNAKIENEINFEDPIYTEGLDILVTSKSTKIGKNVAFCDMKITTIDGNTTLASGNHIKYMQMGFIWDLIMSPSLIHFTFWILNVFPILSKFFSKSNKNNNSNESNIVFEPTGGAFSKLALLKPDSSNSKYEPNLFELNVEYCLKNPLGSLHGGALALACEEAYYLKSQTNKFEKLKSMEIRFLSNMTGKVQIKLDDNDNNINNLSESSSLSGYVLDKKSNLSAQFKLLK